MPLFMLYVVLYIVFDPKNQVPVLCLRMRMRNKKFKVQTCTSEDTANVFWDSAEMLLVVFLKRGATIDSERFVQILKKLKQRIGRMRPNKKLHHVLLLPAVRI